MQVGGARWRHVGELGEHEHLIGVVIAVVGGVGMFEKV